MGEPQPQLELSADGGATGGGITIDLKANPADPVKPDPERPAPAGGPLAAAYLLDAKAKGGKLSAETALTIMRSAGLVEPAPPEPDFDWYDEGGARVLNEQLSIAVYINKQGDAVIRRQQCAYEDEDAVVVVAYENLPRVIAALQKIAKAPKEEPE